MRRAVARRILRYVTEKPLHSQEGVSVNGMTYQAIADASGVDDETIRKTVSEFSETQPDYVIGKIPNQRHLKQGKDGYDPMGEEAIAEIIGISQQRVNQVLIRLLGASKFITDKAKVRISEVENDIHFTR